MESVELQQGTEVPEEEQAQGNEEEGATVSREEGRGQGVHNVMVGEARHGQEA